jgi:hypothetical protein
VINLELGIPDDEDAMITSGRVAASISASNLVFNSSFSGAFCGVVSIRLESIDIIKGTHFLDKVDLGVMLL